ncbi:MAG: hypothetical protein EXS36_11490 [Pedosphaera sp.]|nr:hypothetical protein [Pedosphaera sp.]
MSALACGMSETNFLKCSCDHCGGNIEFPTDGAGASTACPHCGKQTTLVAPESGNAWMGWGMGVVLFVALTGAGGMVYLRKASETKPAQIPVTASAPKRAKSLNDLKVGEIAFEETRGSKLIYVLGTVRNESDYQRFGVKVELNLLDRSERKVGTATDYVQILEPRKEWRFRALVLDASAASARLASIQEE